MVEPLLNKDELLLWLEGQKDWSLTQNNEKLEKKFQFKNFLEAISWMMQIGIEAEKLNHHPEWFNFYNKVDVALTTHDSGGITALDITLAKKMDHHFNSQNLL